MLAARSQAPRITDVTEPTRSPQPGTPPLPLPEDDRAAPPSGHRARLRARLLAGGVDALGDHEVIEFLLTMAIPRCDVKPLARTLLQRFGSLAAVLNADPETLVRHRGMGEASTAALRIVAVAARRLAREQVRQAPVLASWQALIDYLMIDMAHLTVERVRILYLDVRNMVILDDHVGDGSLDEAAIHPREVIRRALDIGAAALILAHNHPTHSNRSRWITHKHAETLGNSRIFSLA